MKNARFNSSTRDWFALPFIPNPETHPAFSACFGRPWQDALMMSLFNTLSVTFACLPPPRLAEYNAAAAKVRRLREENEALKARLVAMDKMLRQK